MLEGICDGSKCLPIVNGRDACYKICDLVKLIQPEWNGVLLSTLNMGKGLQKLFKVFVEDISQVCQFG